VTLWEIVVFVLGSDLVSGIVVGLVLRRARGCPHTNGHA
jgi:uncharacterized membrane protein AbrB (regulator of aidB expression)